MNAQAKAPIIIKRKKVISGGGHHGGAWKVAYADFVTAMMAFFMLMWLLNATSEDQKTGIADYFSPTTTFSRVSGGGDGLFGGDSLFSQDTLTQSGAGASAMHSGRDSVTSTDPTMTDAQAAELAQVAALQDIEQTLLGRGGESTVSERALRHIVTKVTDEGLIIELFDVEGAQLFVEGTDTPTAIMIEIAAMLARIAAVVENPIALTSHIRSHPIVRRENINWDLSVSRASRMRVMMESGGLDPDRISRLTGGGDRHPVVKDSTAIRNNRMEVVLLRTE